MQKSMIDYDILIIRYLESNIEPEERNMLMHWVKASKENEEYFVQMAKVWEKSTIELQDKKAVLKKADVFFERMKSKKRRRLYQWIASSAAAVLLLLWGLQIWEIKFPFNSQMISIATYDTKKEVILPDSSIVWLNAGSLLKYPKKFNNKRSVTLEGEAFF